ncbi:MAG TPA: tetratricopeptide repeat protein [Nostoc sp.]|uniref:tetratricopeptide repeat protein n=1 Tax=Nostoc sp. TaxID=1180 RepID=UPI002D38223F|nr:tetratricopeptide repeat protein [Nostoc sp.]HYX16515.1 tetratricopeptide repeat protein [Nostoc sp.]
MQWADFLANEAAIHGLSPEQTAAFVERLKTENSGKSEAKLASELNIGAAAFKKRMTEVYDKFGQSYPELANSESRGKLEKLRACLTAKYNGGQDAHTTIKEIHFTGRYSEAETMYQQALAICERTLNVGHPDTMMLRGSYARFLREAYH